MRRERCMLFPTPSRNVPICVDVHPSKIITTVPAQGIQVEIGASLTGKQTHVQATGDQRQASVKA